jgi:7,8-dihydropterin-6-yl-methyl-4-(beta-D-ribofuranosyl)aminobenzene 5'-phosphate synthase
MKVTIIYDNEVYPVREPKEKVSNGVYKEGLVADWGFSCLVEVENTPKILFDTGTNGSILLSNMEKLNIDPASIDEVFISHPHFDHIGGLSAFLNVRSDVRVYVPVLLRGVRGAKEVISISEPVKIHENVFSTGELDGIEQSMAVKTGKGIVLIVGCSHPKMADILKAASQFGKVYAIVGGMHGFSEFELFKDMELICPAHCTAYKAQIKSSYPDKCVVAGAGKVIEI